MSHHRSTLAGVALAAIGLTVLGSHGPAVGAQVSSGVTAKAPVAGKLGFVSAPTASVSLVKADGVSAGAPGETVTADVDMTVESNKAYSVTVQALSGTMTSTTSSDTISIGDLKTTDAASAVAGLSDTAAVTVVSTTAKSAVGGDPITNTLSLTIPWVEPGEYSVGLNYTIAQN